MKVVVFEYVNEFKSSVSDILKENGYSLSDMSVRSSDKFIEVVKNKVIPFLEDMGVTATIQIFDIPNWSKYEIEENCYNSNLCSLEETMFFVVTDIFRIIATSDNSRVKNIEINSPWEWD